MENEHVKEIGLPILTGQKDPKEATFMEKEDENYLNISSVLNELEKDLSSHAIEVKKEKTAPTGKDAILKVLTRAADDHKFLARLAEDPARVLKEYDLTTEEKAALMSADVRKIEFWVGKLDKRLFAWIDCRLQQEKW